MAQPPEDRADARPDIRLHIPVPPNACGPFTYVASAVNTALAATAHDELMDDSAELIPAIADLTVSPMYVIARDSLEQDLQAATAAGRRLAIDTFAARMLLAGTKLRTEGPL